MALFTSPGLNTVPTTSRQEGVADYAAPYVTNMLARGAALANAPMPQYTGQLTAGPSALQSQAFQGISNLTLPQAFAEAQRNLGQVATKAQNLKYDPLDVTAQEFNTEYANKYMNPYLSAALDPVLAEQRRQAEIGRVSNAGRMTQQGAYGGGRQAIMESEGLRNLADLQTKTTAEGYKTAYDKAMDQFNREQGLGLQAQDLTNKYGLGAIEEQAKLGAVERGITSEGIAADKAQFEEERADPFKKVQFQQSLFQGMPVQAQSYTPAQTSALQDLLSAGSMSTALYKQLKDLKVI